MARPRWRQIHQVIDWLASPDGNRSERAQLAFSLPYSEKWRRDRTGGVAVVRKESTRSGCTVELKSVPGPLRPHITATRYNAGLRSQRLLGKPSHADSCE